MFKDSSTHGFLPKSIDRVVTELMSMSSFFKQNSQFFLLSAIDEETG